MIFLPDINVNISDNTQIVSQAGFGLCLVVCTTKAQPYKEYDISEDLTAVEADFASNTPVYEMINTFAAQNPRPTKVAIFGVSLGASETKATDLTTALNTLITTNNDWYRMLLDDTTEALIAAVSAWTETNSKMFYSEFANTTFTTDLTTKARTVLGYKENADRLDCAMAGYAASRIPGSFTFKFKPFNGITADAITPAELTTIKSKNMNSYFTKFAVIGLGTAQLDGGVVTNGKFIDQIESRDWVQYRIEQEIAKLLMSSEKIPYNNDGIQQVVMAVMTALNDAFDNQIIDTKADKTPAFVVNYNTVDKISAADKTARKLTGITFSYVELGSVHEVTVNGAVVLQL